METNYACCNYLQSLKQGVPLYELRLWSTGDKGRFNVFRRIRVSTNVHGYLGGRGIHIREQMEGWKKMTQGVHVKKGKY